jgi:hypothetical protein
LRDKRVLVSGRPNSEIAQMIWTTTLVIVVLIRIPGPTFNVFT